MTLFLCTYPVLINNVYNRDQPPGMRPKGDVSHPANLHEAPEHLKLRGGGEKMIKHTP